MKSYNRKTVYLVCVQVSIAFHTQVFVKIQISIDSYFKDCSEFTGLFNTEDYGTGTEIIRPTDLKWA